MKDILQAIKGWFSAATYITLKHEMIIRLKQKLGEEKGLLINVLIRMFEIVSSSIDRPITPALQMTKYVTQRTSFPCCKGNLDPPT